MNPTLHTQPHLVRTLHLAKATLHEFEDRFERVKSDDLPARLRRSEEIVEAMDISAQLITQIGDAVLRLIGKDVWAEALSIAYAPIELEGYRRVAEYYRRLDRIEKLGHFGNPIKE